MSVKLQRRGKRYYAVWYDKRTGETMKRSLKTDDLDDAIMALSFFEETPRPYLPEWVPVIPDAVLLRKWAVKLCKKSKENARVKSRPYDLDWQKVAAMLQAQKFRCSVTNHPFSFDLTTIRNPFAPSIDQILAGKGYTTDNVRITCSMVNFAMGQWGEKPFMKLVQFMKWNDMASLRFSREI